MPSSCASLDAAREARGTAAHIALAVANAACTFFPAFCAFEQSPSATDSVPAGAPPPPPLSLSARWTMHQSPASVAARTRSAHSTPELQRAARTGSAAHSTPESPRAARQDNRTARTLNYATANSSPAKRSPISHTSQLFLPQTNDDAAVTPMHATHAPSSDDQARLQQQPQQQDDAMQLQPLQEEAKLPPQIGSEILLCTPDPSLPVPLVAADGVADDLSQSPPFLSGHQASAAAVPAEAAAASGAAAAPLPIADVVMKAHEPSAPASSAEGQDSDPSGLGTSTSNDSRSAALSESAGSSNQSDVSALRQGFDGLDGGAGADSRSESAVAMRQPDRGEEHSINGQQQVQQAGPALPWADTVAFVRDVSANLCSAALFSPYPAMLQPSIGAASPLLLHAPPFQKVLLVHTDLSDRRLCDQQNRTATNSVLPYTPVPAMLFGGAPSGRNNGILALLLADVAPPNRTIDSTCADTAAARARLQTLSSLKTRLLSLPREPLCGSVTDMASTQENGIAEEYRTLSVPQRMFELQVAAFAPLLSPPLLLTESPAFIAVSSLFLSGRLRFSPRLQLLALPIRIPATTDSSSRFQPQQQMLCKRRRSSSAAARLPVSKRQCSRCWRVRLRWI